MPRREQKHPYYNDADGQEVTLPFCFEICGRCDGHGKSSAYLGAFSGEDMAEDPDFAEEYMAGGYDRTCEECGGSGKIKAANREKMTAAQIAAYDEHLQEEASYYATIEAERRMGA